MADQLHYAWKDACKRTIWVPLHEHKHMLQGRFTYDTRHFTRCGDEAQVMDVLDAKTKRQITMYEQKRWLRTLGLPIPLH